MDHPSDEGRGSQQIGNLTNKIVGSLRASASTPTELPRSTGTIGLPSLERRGSSSTGGRPGATGAVSRLPGLAEVMARDDPEATDSHILRSLPRSVGSCLSREVREFIDEQYGYDFEVIGYRMQPCLAFKDDRRAARRLVEAAMMPASVQVIQAALARLRAGTKARPEAEGDLAMVMQVLAEECAEFPPDVVRAACRRWLRRERWFPAVAELRDEMQRLARNREMIERALRDYSEPTA